MDTKRCSGCGKTKGVSEFHKHSGKPDGLTPYCRTCRSHQYGSNLERNRESARARAAIRYARNRAVIDAAKEGPCAHCGRSYPPYVMDLHHEDPADKDFNVAQMMWQSPEKLAEEIAKCVLLCANCHRVEEYRILTQRGDPACS